MDAVWCRVSWCWLHLLLLLSEQHWEYKSPEVITNRTWVDTLSYYMAAWLEYLTWFGVDIAFGEFNNIWCWLKLYPFKSDLNIILTREFVTTPFVSTLIWWVMMMWGSTGQGHCISVTVSEIINTWRMVLTMTGLSWGWHDRDHGSSPLCVTPDTRSSKQNPNSHEVSVCRDSNSIPVQPYLLLNESACRVWQAVSR